MTTTKSFADWVDWLAIELTCGELYESAPPSLRNDMTTTVGRLATDIGEAEVYASVSRVPNFERALSSFSLEDQGRLAPQFSLAVTEFARHLASVFAEPD